MSGPDTITPAPSPSQVIERRRVFLDGFSPEMEPEA
jgi:hypothetical protein